MRVYYPALSCVLFYICEMYVVHKRASTIFHKSYYVLQIPAIDTYGVISIALEDFKNSNNQVIILFMSFSPF